MYIAPPEIIMLGDIHMKRPNWVTTEDMERTNNTSELIRSQVSTFYRSIGVNAERAEPSRGRPDRGKPSAAHWPVLESAR
ncbi:hypothetical protein GS507_28915, partial [Rhodococcus hoagii]|nr:hypothetical protein [Prescottella equi]